MATAPTNDNTDGYASTVDSTVRTNLDGYSAWQKSLKLAASRWKESFGAFRACGDNRLTPRTVSLSYYHWYEYMDRQSVRSTRLTPWTLSLSYYHWYEYMDQHSVRSTGLTPPQTVSLSYYHWYEYMDRQSVRSTGLTPPQTVSWSSYIIKTEQFH